MGVKALILKFIKPWICKHDYQRIETYHGDRIIAMGYARSKWKCRHCQHEKYSNYLSKIG